MIPTTESRDTIAPPGSVKVAATKVALNLSTFLAGVPAETRELAIDAYRRITLELLTSRGLSPEQASPLVEHIVAEIRLRIAAVDRAGGTVAGRA
ncbi:MAG TPA: hypothetical protein VD978_31820 [Azospirillum sp.]|nr:hypothetical protein [Azospirillum sp.]